MAERRKWQKGGPTKPRTRLVGFELLRPATLTGVRVNADGSLSLMEADGGAAPVQAALSEVRYDRGKKPKITVHLPDVGTSLGSVTDAAARYSRIIGVDTNTATQDGRRVSVTAVVELVDLRVNHPHWSARTLPLWAFEFHEPTKDPERTGWAHALARGASLGWYGAPARVLLVVDAHLGDHLAMNARTKPFIDRLLLPEAVTLAYASADTPNDSVLNGLMATCDRLAGQVRRDAYRRGIDEGLQRDARLPCAAFRHWEFDLQG